MPNLPDKEKVGLLLRKGYVRSSTLINAHLKQFSLTISEYSILCKVCDLNTEVDQKQLAADTSILPNRIVALVDALEHRGLLERRRDKCDRRRNVLVITQQGRTLFDDATVRVITAHKILFQGFSKNERDTFLELLWRFITK
jgi:DNA-binding MarR family transcriptional regulator